MIDAGLSSTFWPTRQSSAEQRAPSRARDMTVRRVECVLRSRLYRDTARAMRGDVKCED